jgi:Ger(x)C family germination protein
MLTISIAFSFSGCWDSKDIEQKDIHISVTIDYKDGNYIYYGEVANLSGNPQNGTDTNKKNQSFDIITAKGESFVQARAQLEQKSSKTLYLGACEILIFTHRLPNMGFEEYLNRSRAQNETRKSLKLITTSTEPEKLLKTPPDNSLSVGLSIEGILEKMFNDGDTISVDIGDILELLAVKKVGFLIPEVNIDESNLTLTGYTVFKNSKIVGEIPIKQGNGIVYFFNSKANLVYNIANNSIIYNIDAHLKNKSIKTVYQDGKLKIQVGMNFVADLNYANIASIPDQDNINQIQDSLAKILKDEIIQTLVTSQKKFQCDYLGIFRYFKIHNNTEFKTIDWEKIYSEAAIEVSTKVTIRDGALPQK